MQTKHTDYTSLVDVTYIGIPRILKFSMDGRRAHNIYM